MNGRDPAIYAKLFTIHDVESALEGQNLRELLNSKQMKLVNDNEAYVGDTSASSFMWWLVIVYFHMRTHACRICITMCRYICSHCESLFARLHRI